MNRHWICTILVFMVTAGSLSAQSSQGYPRLMQGPMLGATGPHTVNIWVRTSGAFPVSIRYSADEDMRNAVHSPAVMTDKADDYTAVITLQNLEPQQRYFYEVYVNDAPDPVLKKRPPFRLNTAPLQGQPANFSLAFGSCARFQEDRIQPIWEAVNHMQPDIFMWTGDNIYGDALDADILREEYRRQRDVASLQPVLHNVSHLAIWDDHDYGLNDHDRTSPMRQDGLAVFKGYWANPSYGTTDTPGVFFHTSYGAVDFFALDVRYYRDPNRQPDGADKTMLGADQLAWLKNKLKDSNAVFKIIFSGSGWSKAKGKGGDSWAGFLHERNALFNFIRDENIRGVVLVSGDTHVGELNRIPWSEQGGYDFYDLISSPLAQLTVSGWMHQQPEQRVRPVFFQDANFGLIRFDFTDEPTLIFHLYDSSGREAWEPLVLHSHDLKN